MTALTWDSDPVSDGLERVVLFLPLTQGIPWGGFTSVEPSESGSSTTQYFDGVPYVVATMSDSYSASISAFTYPEEFEQCESYPHSIFGLAFRETSTEGDKIHLVWNATAAPTAKTWTSRGEGVDLSDFTWDISTVPTETAGLAPVSHLVVDVSTASAGAVEAIESAIYGTVSTDSYLPTQDEVLQLFADNPWIKITDLGDGTFTIEGPEEVVRQIDATTWDIESHGITWIDEDEYDIETR